MVRIVAAAAVATKVASGCLVRGIERLVLGAAGD